MKKVTEHKHLHFLTTANRSLYNITVDELFPVEFEIYLKIFNPFLVDPKAVSDKNKDRSSLSDFDVESVLNNEMEYSKILNLALKYYDRMSLHSFLKHIHYAYGVDYEYDVDLNPEKLNEVWKPKAPPEWLVAPFTGSMNPKVAKELKKLLKPHTSSKTVWYYYDMLANGFTEEILLKGRMALLDKNENAYGCTATDIWPESEEWHIHTDFDSSFSILGTSKNIGEEILSNEKIEAFVLPKDREIIINI